MILIVNKGRIRGRKQEDDERMYHVYINKDFIARFYHNRSDGLATCLKKAAEAVRISEISHE